MVTDYFNIFACVIFAEILKLRKLGTANGFNIVEEFAIKNEVKTEKLKTFSFKLFTRWKWLPRRSMSKSFTISACL